MATSVQYGIRHLMVLTLAVAVVMAVVGPMIRAWDTERQMFFAVYAVVTLSLLAGHTYFLCVQRLRVERAAGEVVLRAKAPSSLRTRAMQAAGIAFCFALMILQWVVWSGTASSSGHGHYLAAISNSWCMASFLPFLLTRFWWGLSFSSIEVCERGFIVGAGGFRSYSKLKSYRWSRPSANALILVYQFRTFRVEISPEEQGKIDKFLKQHGVPRIG